jgi:hypothetical protein
MSHNETPDEVYARTLRWEIAKRVLIMVSVLISVTLLVIVLHQNKTQLDAIRSTQKANSPVVQAVGRVGRQISDCVTPGGKCYDDGQQRTGAAVLSITTQMMYAAFCAARPNVDTIADMRACMSVASREDR